MMTTFETEFVNNRKTPVQIKDGATVLTYLPPGARGLVEACTPFAMYARWSEVEFTEQGVEFKKRHGWVEPDRGRWTLVATNIDGKPFEERAIGKNAYVLPRFVPVYIGLDPDDREAIYKEFKIARVEEKVPDPNLSGYIVSTIQLRDVWVDRSENELAELKKLREEMGYSEISQGLPDDIFAARPVFGGGPQNSSSR